MRWCETKHKWAIASKGGLQTQRCSSSNDPTWRDLAMLFRTRKLARLECPKGCRVVKVIVYYFEVVSDSEQLSETDE